MSRTVTHPVACPSAAADSQRQSYFWGHKQENWPLPTQIGYLRDCIPLYDIADQVYTSPKQVQEQNMGRLPLQRLLQRIKGEALSSSSQATQW